MAVGRVILVLLACVCLSECGSTTPVYTDSVLAPFSDYSWGTKNNAFTGDSRSVRTFSFTPASWSAAYFFARGEITKAKYSGLQFWIKRLPNAPTNINFNLVVDVGGQAQKIGPDENIAKYLPNNLFPENTWILGTVSFAGFPDQAYDGLFFQDQTGAPNSFAILLDDIALINSDSTTTTTTTRSPITTTTTRSPLTTTTTRSPITTRIPSTTTTRSPTTTTTTRSPTTTTSTRSPTTTTTTRSPSTTTTTTTTRSPTTTTTTSTRTPVGGDAEVQRFYTTTQISEATYYGAYSNGGACMLDPTPPTGLPSAGVMHTVAIKSYLGSKTCGMCISLTGHGKGKGALASAVNDTRIVYVNNECPSCNAGGLDIGLDGDGVWDITWKAVPCPVGSSKIQYIFKGGSNEWYFGLQPRNTKYPVYKLEVKKNGVWVNIVRKAFNYFEDTSQGFPLPIQIQLTSVNGEVLTDTISSFYPGVFGSERGVQFN